MFIRKKVIEGWWARLDAIEERMAQLITAAEEHIKTAVSATDPGVYWCGAFLIGKGHDGSPVTMSSGLFLGKDNNGIQALRLEPLVDVRAGAIVIAQGPCIMHDVVVGNRSQCAGCSTGLPVCVLTDACHLGNTIVARIERLSYPARGGWR
jgi:hypothetical protein